MTRPYSIELRARMVRAVEAGASRRATAARFGVSPSCVIKLVQRWQRAGTLAPGVAIAAAGAQVLYLPPYSPDLNPIEHAFARPKALLRTAAARTVEELWHTIGQLLDAFSPAECAHYLAHAGYVPSNREIL
jgi:transposase